MNQKVIKRLRKFCLLFDLDFEHAKTVFNQMTDKEKDHEMREMKFALNIKAEEVKVKKMKIDFKKDIKYTVAKNMKKQFDNYVKSRTKK